MATGFEFTEWFMKEQDLVFLNLCEYLLFDIELNRNINKFSVTFFYNLLCTFDGVYKKVLKLIISSIYSRIYDLFWI